MASNGLSPVAIVTGAAQGIGYAISDRLLQEGYRVCLADVNNEKGKQSLTELQGKYGESTSVYMHCDVTSETSFEETFSKTQQIFGRIDLLVNNAGIADEHNPKLTVAVDLMGPIIGSHLALKFMGTSHGGKGGVVVNISSISGLFPSVNFPVYSATKHGVVGLTRAYGDELHLEKNGVIFMTICPYYVDTSLLQTSKSLEMLDHIGIEFAMTPEFVAEGVVKLLKDRDNGSVLIAIPGKLVYVDVPNELKEILNSIVSSSAAK